MLVHQTISLAAPSPKEQAVRWFVSDVGCIFYKCPRYVPISRKDTDMLERFFVNHVYYGTGTCRSMTEGNYGMVLDSKDIDDLADLIFYDRHPNLAGQRLSNPNSALAYEWKAIRKKIMGEIGHCVR